MSFVFVMKEKPVHSQLFGSKSSLSRLLPFSLSLFAADEVVAVDLLLFFVVLAINFALGLKK